MSDRVDFPESDGLVEDIVSRTQLSHKQATAYIMRKVMKADNADIAKVIDVKDAASASSYVTRAKTKTERAEEEIEELEQAIEDWERTKDLGHIVASLDENNEHPDRNYEEFKQRVEAELLSEKTQYLVRYSKDEEQRVEVIDRHPDDINREVIDYKRISGLDEIFAKI